MFLILAAAPTVAQDTNIMLPPDSIEGMLRFGEFSVVSVHPSRGLPGERTNRVALQYPDQQMLLAKWATSQAGGEAFNNQPRFEVAAYELQKLLLDGSEIVVPPTVLRAVPLADYPSEMDDGGRPTFPNTGSIIVTLQYWLYNVTPDDFWDEKRFDADTAYARTFGNFNAMTYLVRHNDQNEGNFLLSKDPRNPRVFAVDNGLSFSSPVSDRGARWRSLRVKRLPAKLVADLRALTEDDLVQRLETVAQFRILADGRLEQMTEFTPNLDANRGVRRTDEYIQFGLTRREIRGVYRRIEDLLKDVDRGRIESF